MANLFAELKRRHIYRVAAAYAVVAWVLLQLVANVSPILDLPPWIARSILLLLVIGFPIALVFAWVQQLAPEGGALTRVSTGKLDWALVSALLIVIALVSYQQLAPAPAAKTAQGQQAGVAASRVTSATQAGAVSIAVLPFTNLSSDPNQEFFSDGMTEEITSALAKVPNLRVVGRTSAFQFKGENKDLRTIGQALSATHLIEGSVRKDGNQLRITAQLIKADDGTHLWTESYDRELKGVFAVQEDIAKAIVAALKVPLGLHQAELFVTNRAISTDSYQKYLRARGLVRTRQPMQATDANGLLEEITARDTDYAPAWALLALAYDVTPQDAAWYSGAMEETRRVGKDSLPKAEAAALRAIQLDANLADGYASLGRVQLARGELLRAEESYSRALALDPNNPDALLFYGNLLAEVGHLKEALAVMQRLRAVEPFVPIHNLNASVVLWLNGQADNAIAIMEALPRVAARDVDLSEIYASEGRYGEAADELRNIPAGTFLPGIAQEGERLLRKAPGKADSLEAIPRLGRLGFVYLYIGAPLRALEFHEAGVDAAYTIAITTAVLWHPSYAPVRKTERFKAFARKAGFVDYWRARGWPDLCRPMGADDFVCD